MTEAYRYDPAAYRDVFERHWGQLVVAYVVPADDSLTAAECEKHCQTHPMLAG